MVKKKKHIGTESLRQWQQTHLNRYNTVANSNNAIDTKSGIMLAASIAVLAFGVPGVSKDPSLLGLAGTLGLLVCAGIAVANLHVRDASDEAVTSEDRIDYYDLDDHTFAWKLLSDVEGATAKNKLINEQKAKLYYWIVYTFVVSSFWLLLSYFITFTLVPR